MHHNHTAIQSIHPRRHLVPLPPHLCQQLQSPVTHSPSPYPSAAATPIPPTTTSPPRSDASLSPSASCVRSIVALPSRIDPIRPSGWLSQQSSQCYLGSPHLRSGGPAPMATPGCIACTESAPQKYMMADAVSFQVCGRGRRCRGQDVPAYQLHHQQVPLRIRAHGLRQLCGDGDVSPPPPVLAIAACPGIRDVQSLCWCSSTTILLCCQARYISPQPNFCLLGSATNHTRSGSSTRPGRRITTGCAHCPIPRPTSSSSASASPRPPASRTCGKSGSPRCTTTAPACHA